MILELLHLLLQVGVSVQAVMLSSGASAGMKLKASHCNARERHNSALSAGPLGYWAAGLLGSFPLIFQWMFCRMQFFFVLFVCFLVYSPDTNSKEFPSHLNRFSFPSLLSLSLSLPLLYFPPLLNVPPRRTELPF